MRPPRPPHGMTATLLDEFDVGSELIVTIDAKDVMAIELRSASLEVGGWAKAAVRRFADGSWFALGDVPVLGRDHLSRRDARGRASVGLAWRPSRAGRAVDVGGSAIVEGDWTGGLFRFGRVASHHGDARLSWLTPWRLVAGRTVDGSLAPPLPVTSAELQRPRAERP